MVTKSIPISMKITDCCLIKRSTPFELTEKSMKTDTTRKPKMSNEGKASADQRLKQN